jgi:hypothetical protein
MTEHTKAWICSDCLTRLLRMIWNSADRPTQKPFAMSTKAIGNKLQRLAAQWPADPLRPHLQLKTFLESLSHHPNLTDEAVIATRSLFQNDLRHKVRRSIVIANPVTHGHATSPPRCVVQTWESDDAASFHATSLRKTHGSVCQKFPRHWPTLVEKVLQCVVVSAQYRFTEPCPGKNLVPTSYHHEKNSPLA